jgi:hypothetical protein
MISMHAPVPLVRIRAEGGHKISPERFEVRSSLRTLSAMRGAERLPIAAVLLQ